MLLKYVSSLELNTGHISSLDFSECGRILAVVNAAGEICLWDAKNGTRYNPILSSGTSGGSTTLWIDGSVLACGLSDGSLATCNLLNSNLPCASGQFVRSLFKFVNLNRAE